MLERHGLRDVRLNVRSVSAKESVSLCVQATAPPELREGCARCPGERTDMQANIGRFPRAAHDPNRAAIQSHIREGAGYCVYIDVSPTQSHVPQNCCAGIPVSARGRRFSADRSLVPARRDGSDWRDVGDSPTEPDVRDESEGAKASFCSFYVFVKGTSHATTDSALVLCRDRRERLGLTKADPCSNARRAAGEQACEGL